jgi:hypothetical protein
MKMKNILLKPMKAIILVIMILLNCGILNKPPKKDAREIDFFTSAALLNYNSGEKAEVIDNKDGTLNYTYIKWSSTAGIYTETRGKTILVRRCLIGQVYRPEQNDCRGTGTESDTWGATRYEWCPTNDTSCEVNGIADPTKSPAAKACAEDTFLGKKWRLPSLEDRFDTDLIKGLDELKDYVGTEINYLGYAGWTNQAVSTSESMLTNITYIKGFGQKKNLVTHIICIGGNL